MAFRDFLELGSFRRSKAVPAVLALVIAGLAWLGVQSLFAGDAPQPAEPPVAVQRTEIPAPNTETAEPDTGTAAPEATADSGGQSAHQPVESPPVYPNLLLATRDLKSGVMLTSELVEWREWVEPIDLNRVVLQDAVPLQAILGSVTRRTYAAGTPIGWDGVITPGGPGFIGAVLAPGMRAVTVEVDRATTSANIIYPGDRVDVIMVSAQQAAEALAQAIVRDVRVLAVGSTIYSLGRYGKVSLTKAGAIEPVAQPAGENYTLELLPADAERVALAVNTGRLTLAMRSVNSAPWYDMENRRPVRLSEVLVNPDPPPPPAAAPVRIIRGGAGESRVAADT